MGVFPSSDSGTFLMAGAVDSWFNYTGQVSGGLQAGNRPLALWDPRPIAPDLFFPDTSQTGDGLRTNCATTVPSVSKEIREMIPREMAQ
jgi:hypothetical protein